MQGGETLKISKVKFIIRHFRPLVQCCSLLPLLCGAQAFADDFVINIDVFETNGGNTLEGNDSITVTTEGSVTTSVDSEIGL